MAPWNIGSRWKGGALLANGYTRQSLLALREGYGAAATGGFSGPEVVVTTLADDPSVTHNTPGDYSLRGALAVSGAKWITFAPGMTAPARSTWPAPYNGAPSSAWRGDAIWVETGNDFTVPADTTIDGRGTSIVLQGRGVLVNGSNVIVHNLTIDYSQWWAANKSQGQAGLYNIWDADMTYSLGPQPIQRAGQAWGTLSDQTKLPGNWKGAWVSGTPYQAGSAFTTSAGTPPDGVVYNSLGYKCILATSGTTPPPSDSTHWQRAIGGSVNGEIFGGVKAAGGPYQDIWFDHNTLIGVAQGDGNPVFDTGLWDSNDGGFALCNDNHNVTYSWNYFVHMNKSSILGCNTTDSSDLVSLHHNRFQGGIQRQPLARGGNGTTSTGHFHVYSNWYDQPGQPGGGGECIAVDNSAQVLYEGNLAESAINQTHALAFNRSSGAALVIVGKTHGNVALDQMTLANDVHPTAIAFTIPYPYTQHDLPNLLGNYSSAAASQAAFRTLITNGAGAR